MEKHNQRNMNKTETSTQSPTQPQRQNRETYDNEPTKTANKRRLK